jgi:hypothetical protein
LGVVAVTLMVNTYLLVNLDGGNMSTPRPVSNAAANPVSNLDLPAIPEPAKPQLPPTVMAFGELDHDFGSIDQDTDNKKVFTFTNTGSMPLVIESAKGSCGCTVPSYPKEPIAPGATGEIEVVYKPGKQKGVQNKTVTLVANTEPSSTILKIKADVQEIAADVAAK